MFTVVPPALLPANTRRYPVSNCRNVTLCAESELRRFAHGRWEQRAIVVLPLPDGSQMTISVDNARVRSCSHGGFLRVSHPDEPGACSSPACLSATRLHRLDDVKAQA
jgi:hypothetical protein